MLLSLIALRRYQVISACFASLATFGINSAPGAAGEAERTGGAIVKFGTKLWKGDLPGMRKRGFVRVLVSYSRSNFFIDRGRPHGFEYVLMNEYERYINGRKKRQAKKTEIIFVPVPFDQLIPSLIAGKGDIIAAGMTVTPSRSRRIEFSHPYLNSVKEVVVIWRRSQAVQKLEDLAGRQLPVVRGSSYVEHLRRLNQRFTRENRQKIRIVEAPIAFEAEDILELVNTGAVKATIVDEHIGMLWAGLLPNIVVRKDLAINQRGKIGWGVRKGSPKLKKSLSQFAKKVRRGTYLGNVYFKRYYASTKWISNPLRTAKRKQLQPLIEHFKEYGTRYDFDWLLLAAIAYQESQIDQRKRSRAGAVGIMQVLPKTAASRAVGIRDVTTPKNNIHAGTKYLAFLRDRYFADRRIKPADRVWFALAAYNAGPTRINRLRQLANRRGLDGHKWFGHVENIVLSRVGREPVRYVRNITKYYFTYKALDRGEIERNSKGPDERKR